MSEAEFVTLTCPRCATQLRARATDAGKKVRCPDPHCRLLVTVPFALDATDLDEPDEPVLLPEDPTNPESVPVAEPVSTPAPEPRRKPRRYEEDEEPKARAAVRLWALNAFAFLLAGGAVLGWALTSTGDRPADSAERITALESENRALRAENQKLRERLNPTKPDPKLKEPDKGPDGRADAREISYTGFLNLIDAGQVGSVTLFEDRAEGEVRDPNHELAQEQRIGARGLFAAPLPHTNDLGPLVHRIEQADQRFRTSRALANQPVPEPVVIVRRDKPNPPSTPKPPEGRDAFVGKWAVTDQQIDRAGGELSVEFRANGTCVLEFRTGAGALPQQLPGTWQWEGGRLSLSINGAPARPAEVKWNGPDEFVGTADNMPATVRRKR